MSKIKYLIIIIISTLFFSCKNQERESLINKSEAQREKNGLISFNENLKLDSTIYLRSDQNDWKLVNYIATHERLKLNEKKKGSVFSIMEFYSVINNNQFKIVYYSNNGNILRLVSEEDRYYKKLNDTVEIYLSHRFNHLKVETIFSIDSLPTKFFVEKNQKKLKDMIKYGKENNLELCGTAQSDILKEGFPKRYTEINYSEYNKIKKELNK